MAQAGGSFPNERGKNITMDFAIGGLACLATAAQ